MESAPIDGVGLMSCDVSWLWELVPVLLVDGAELLVSLKGSAVNVSRFRGVCRFSIPLDNPSGFVSVRHIYFHSHFKVAPLRIILLSPAPTCPGIFAGASAPWSCLGLQTKACQVGACMDLSLLPDPSLCITEMCMGFPQSPEVCPICHRACVHLLAGLLDPPSMLQVLCALVLRPTLSRGARWKGGDPCALVPSHWACPLCHGACVFF